MKQYSGLAQFYDKAIDIDYCSWIDFVSYYLKSRGVGVEGKKVLELGCGTGNMTLMLKKKGMDVTALDISEDMLTIAEQKLRENGYKVNFALQDMIYFNMGRTYDFVCSFCDGYNYVFEDGDLKKSFDRVYKHLNPGGYFIFDISTLYKLKNIIGNNTFTLNEDDMCYIWDNYMDDDIIEMYITFFIKEGNMYKRVDETHIQRAYGTDTIIKCLNDSGFNKIEVYDDYTLENINDISKRATFIVQKDQ